MVATVTTRSDNTVEDVELSLPPVDTLNCYIHTEVTVSLSGLNQLNVFFNSEEVLLFTAVPAAECITHTVDSSRSNRYFVTLEVNDNSVDTSSLNLVVTRSYETFVSSKTGEVTIPCFGSAELELSVSCEVTNSPEHTRM